MVGKVRSGRDATAYRMIDGTLESVVAPHIRDRSRTGRLGVVNRYFTLFWNHAVKTGVAA
ncbi:hypothetical protein [uncultured Pleomorphomonas sp.]|nr:hypothetical protein [uncultured Pleomorphomonas sp.]